MAWALLIALSLASSTQSTLVASEALSGLSKGGESVADSLTKADKARCDTENVSRKDCARWISDQLARKAARDADDEARKKARDADEAIRKAARAADEKAREADEAGRKRVRQADEAARKAARKAAHNATQHATRKNAHATVTNIAPVAALALAATHASKPNTTHALTHEDKERCQRERVSRKDCAEWISDELARKAAREADEAARKKAREADEAARKAARAADEKARKEGGQAHKAAAPVPALNLAATHASKPNTTHALTNEDKERCQRESVSRKDCAEWISDELARKAAREADEAARNKAREADEAARKKARQAEEAERKPARAADEKSRKKGEASTQWQNLAASGHALPVASFFLCFMMGASLVFMVKGMHKARHAQGSAQIPLLQEAAQPEAILV
jgi:hypothetical protein